MRVFQARNHRAKSQAVEFILNTDGPLTITVEPMAPVRSLARNSQLHAIIGDIAAQKQWDGEWLNVEQWKRLLVAAWMRETGRAIKLVRSLDGTTFDPLYQRTSRLTEAECRELIQYIYAWGVDQGVRFTEPTTTNGASHDDSNSNPRSGQHAANGTGRSDLNGADSRSARRVD